MLKYYAGIGSRDTPGHILRIMSMIGSYLGNNGWTLRSGGAQGADSAFEEGADQVNAPKEIYLPWRGYNGHSSNLNPKNYPFSGEELDFSAKFHPKWNKLSPSVRLLMARNTRILAGMKEIHGPLVRQSTMIICWTKDGLIQGGTGQALRIAKAFEDTSHFKVINLGKAK